MLMFGHAPGNGAWRNTQEELLNGALARLLKDRGLDAEAEQHIDVLVNVGGRRTRKGK